MEELLRLLEQRGYFLAPFALAWLLICALLARVGGWADLAKRYRAEDRHHRNGERYRFVSGSIGRGFRKVRYGSCLSVIVSDQGIQLSLMFPFGFGSPPLFLPWRGVATITQERARFENRAVITLKDHRVPISLDGKAADALLTGYAQRLPQWTGGESAELQARSPL